MNILDFIPKNSWSEFFNIPTVKENLDEISNFISKEEKVIYPSVENIFRVFQLPLDKIKVIVLGQDPYYNGSANGLAFSIENKNKINPSLVNIMKEVENCGFNIKDRKNGDLSVWMNRGVFLINTALTVEESKPGSHLNLWKKFTKQFLFYITEKRKDIVFLLWGDKAQKHKQSFFEKDFKYITVETSHPSPLSSYRGFIGSKCFLKVNENLKRLNKEEIDWSL